MKKSLLDVVEVKKGKAPLKIVALPTEEEVETVEQKNEVDPPKGAQIIATKIKKARKKKKTK